MLHGGKPAGEIKCDMHYFAVSAEEKQEDGTVIPAAESCMFLFMNHRAPNSTLVPFCRYGYCAAYGL